MQKKILTMAVASALAMPAVALAQVTVYGTIDGGIRQQGNVRTGPTTDESVLTMTDGLRTTNRWGLKGSEDMGGGLMANFTLEGQFGSDTGALGSSPAFGAGPTLIGTTGSANVNQGLFQRKAVVGLSSGGNSVDVGRDYTVNFKAQGIYDPMSYTYTGVTPTAGTNVAGTRSSNMVTAGFRFGAGGVRVDYALGEVVGDADIGTRAGVMADFVFGPVTIAGALSTLKVSPTVDSETMNFGVVYKLGAFTIRGGVSDTDNDATGTSPMLVVGLQYTMSPTLDLRLGYYDTTFENTAGTELGSSKLFIVAMDYSLSKRTKAYVEVDRRDLSGTSAGTAVGSLTDGATAFGVGIAHSF